MPSEADIKVNYIKLHDDLSASYYDGESGLTKEEFDIQHGKIWKDMEAELLTEGHLKSPEPTELEQLKARVEALEKK